LNTREQLIEEIADAPDALLEEAIDFIRFFKSKEAKSSLETTLFSEASLAKDWLRPEEDQAWASL
jgi:hypothetical protein